MSGSNFGLAPPVVVNPLQAQTTALDAAGKVYDLRDKQATEAWGAALQASTDENGNVDLQKAQRLASQNPLARQGMTRTLLNTSTLANEQQTRNLKTNEVLGNAVGATLQLPDDQLKQAVLGQVERLVAGRVITREQANASLMHMSSNPTELRQQLETLRTGLMPSGEATTQISGSLGTQTGLGGRTIGTVQNRRTGAVSSPDQPGAPQGLSAEQAAERTRWLQSPRDYADPANPNVQKHGTNETFLRDSGVPDQYIYPGGAPASPGSQASPFGTGRPPPELLNPKKPPAAPAPAASPTATPAPSPAGTGVSGPTPQQTAEAEATKEQGKLGPPLFQKEVNAGAEAQMQLANYGTMLSDLTKFTSGSGAGKTLDWKRAAVTWAPGLAKALNIKPEEVAAQESFDKVAAQVVQAQNPGSDGRMNLNMAATPHSAQSPEGVDFIIRTLQGNADYIRARASLAANYKEKGNYPAFQESVKDLDPRVFQLARMTQPQRDSYWKSLDDTVQSQLGAAIQKAKDLKVLGG
jgi:hypothetical protein